MDSGFVLEIVNSDLSAPLTVLSKVSSYIYLPAIRDTLAKIGITGNFNNKGIQYSSIQGFVVSLYN